jgi:hypothetical protein
MKTFSLRRLAGAFAWLAASSALSAADEALPKIFNGQDLAGWKVPATNLIWKVADGVLIGQSDDKKTGSMLYTERSYSNFVFETEVRWKGDCDSGVMFRKPELQLQFGISRSLKVDMTCAFYTGGKDAYPMAGRPKNMEKLFKPEDWNRVRLQVIGDTATVWLNGEQVSQYSNPKYASPGPVGLQVHPGVQMKVEFRDVRLKELP